MRVLTAILLLIALATGSCRTADGQDLLDNKVVPLVDHHQHLLSPAGAALQNAYIVRDRLPYDVEQPVVGEHLVAMLDRAGIKRAVVLSDAYWFDSPARARALRDVGVHDIYATVRAENDWTAREVALFSNRLVGFCSFNPLEHYAVQEVDRCAKNPTFRGLKLHFSVSVVISKNKQHVERVRRIFEAANSHRLAITVHVRGDRRYGREHAEIFLNQLLPAAPDTPVQIAHLWGGDGFSEGAAARVLGQVMTQGLIVTTIGVVGGLGGAFALNRLIASLLFGVRPTDAATLVAVVGTITVVAAAASWLPAWRASRVDPTWYSEPINRQDFQPLHGVGHGTGSIDIRGMKPSVSLARLEERQHAP